MSCNDTRNPPEETYYTSNIILYDGTTLSACLGLAGDNTLNEVLYAMGVKICANTAAISAGCNCDAEDVLLNASIDSSPNNLFSYTTADSVQTVLEDLCDQVDANEDAFDNYVLKSLFDANTILAATADDTPAAVTIAEQTLVGRITGGNITALTASEVITLLDVVTRDTVNGVVEPTNNTDGFGMGDDTMTDKNFFYFYEHGTFANNPYLEWDHDDIITGYDGLVIHSMSAQPSILTLLTDQASAYIINRTTGAGAATDTQGIKLEDDVAGTVYGWEIYKDGGDSRALTIDYNNGGASTTRMELTTAGLLSLTSGVGVSSILDEDDMASDSDTALATQQSIKAYVDNATFSDFRRGSEAVVAAGTAVSFASALGSAAYALVIYCYDSDGEQVACKITSRTSSGFTATPAVNATLDYIAMLV